MANIKITDLNASTDPASTDVLAIVDVGADETKKITIADLLENAGSGSAAAPAFAFDADPNTGIYSAGADQLGFATAGTGRLFIDASGKISATQGTVTLGTAAVTNGVINSPESVFINIDSDNDSSGQVFVVGSNRTSTTGGSELFRITETGLVGIGTPSPGAKLVVAGGTDTSYNDGTLKVVGDIALNSANNLNPALNRWALKIRANGTDGAFGIYDARNAAYRQYIDSSGNVGIGTTSPVDKLHVVGASRFGDGTNFAGVSASASGAAFEAAAGSANVLFKTSGSERLRIDSTGTLIHVGGGGSYTTPAVQFNGSAPANSLVIDSSGRVGIGTTSPSLTTGTGLHIAGGDAGLKLQNTVDGSWAYVEYADESNTTKFIQGYRDFTGAYAIRPGSSLSNAGGILINSSGQVGIGSSLFNSTSALQAFSGAAGRSVFRHDSGDGGVTITGSGAGSTASLVFGNNWDSDNGANFSEEYRIYMNGANDALEFRYNNNTSAAMVLDSSGRLLVGTTGAFSAGADSQYGKLQMVGNTFSTAGHAVLALGRGEAATTITADEPLGYVTFSDNAGNTFAQIHGAADATAGSGDYPGRLVFSTTADGASSPTPRMTIKNDGKVGIGVTAPDRQLHVASAASSVVAELECTSLNFASVDISNTGGNAQLVSLNNDLLLSPAGTERARVTSTGYVRLASGTGGIQFNGDTAAANALDDYEEGTWTPTIVGTTTAGTGTYSTQSASYTRVGRLIYATGTVTWSAHTGTGNMRIAGLPFNSVNATELTNAASFTYVSSVTTIPANAITTGGVFPNDNKISLYTMVTGGGSMSGLAISSTGNIYFSVTYQIA